MKFFKGERYLPVVLIICAVWILSGLIGRDPWKPDEAYSFGLVYHIIESGELMVMRLADEPFMEKPPIFYYTAALFAKLLSPPLALHDAARMACAFYLGLSVLFLSLGTRELFGKGKGWIGGILLISCLGVIQAAHLLITDNSLLAGCCLAMYGLILSLRKPKTGGWVCGTGIGLAFMSKGFLAPALIGPALLLLPVFFKAWRTRNYFITFLMIGVGFLPWFLIWPLILYLHSPDLFIEWIWEHNIGRFFGNVKHGPTEDTKLFYLYLMPWFAWPALPLSFWTLWKIRDNPLQKPACFMLFLVFLGMLGLLSAAHGARELYAVPMLAPLCILGAGYLDDIKRGFLMIYNTLTTALFGILTIALWLAGITLMTGWPDVLAVKLEDFQPGFVASFNAFTFLCCLAFTIFWIWLLIKKRPSGKQVLLNWAGGVTLVWMLAMVLLLPLLDAGMTYREVFEDLKTHLPETSICIASRELGESQRAMLHYFAGVKTQCLDDDDQQETECDWFLYQGSQKDDDPIPFPPGHWTQTWSGHRPGDNKELFLLYQLVQYPFGYTFTLFLTAQFLPGGHAGFRCLSGRGRDHDKGYHGLFR